MVEIDDGKARIKTGAKQNAEIGALVAAFVTVAANAPPKPVPSGATRAAPWPEAACCDDVGNGMIESDMR
jgi:hypothetical protein